MKNIRIVATVALFAWLFCHPPALHAREASASPPGCVKTLRDLSYVKAAISDRNSIFTFRIESAGHGGRQFTAGDRPRLMLEFLLLHLPAEGGAGK